MCRKLTEAPGAENNLVESRQAARPAAGIAMNRLQEKGEWDLDSLTSRCTSFPGAGFGFDLERLDANLSQPVAHSDRCELRTVAHQKLLSTKALTTSWRYRTPGLWHRGQDARDAIGASANCLNTFDDGQAGRQRIGEGVSIRGWPSKYT